MDYGLDMDYGLNMDYGLWIGYGLWIMDFVCVFKSNPNP